MTHCDHQIREQFFEFEVNVTLCQLQLTNERIVTFDLGERREKNELFCESWK